MNIKGDWQGYLPKSAADINLLAREIHDSNIRAGWWTDKIAETRDSITLIDMRLPPYVKFVIPTKLALAHSELSEALEGFRKNLMDDHLPRRPMIEVELADAIIRILDIAGALNLDVGGALVEKFNYNQTRPDHKLEARQAEGGKSI